MSVCAGSEYRYVSVTASPTPDPTLGERLARRLDAELATGKHDALFRAN